MCSKKKGGFVYSTEKDFFEEEVHEPGEVIPPSGQQIRVGRDRKMRKGKTVTLITGLMHTDGELKELARELKMFCGTGGSFGDGEIIIQGDMVDRSMEFLLSRGYNVRKTGG